MTVVPFWSGQIFLVCMMFCGTWSAEQRNNDSVLIRSDFLGLCALLSALSLKTLFWSIKMSKMNSDFCRTLRNSNNSGGTKVWLVNGCSRNLMLRHTARTCVNFLNQFLNRFHPSEHYFFIFSDILSSLLRFSSPTCSIQQLLKLHLPINLIQHVNEVFFSFIPNLFSICSVCLKCEREFLLFFSFFFFCLFLHV